MVLLYTWMYNTNYQKLTTSFQIQMTIRTHDPQAHIITFICIIPMCYCVNHYITFHLYIYIHTHTQYINKHIRPLPVTLLLKLPEQKQM